MIREDAVESILKDISNLQRLNYQAQKTIPNLTPQQLAKLKEVNKSFDKLVGELTNPNTGKSLLEGIASSRSLQSIVDSEQNKVYSTLQVNEVHSYILKLLWDGHPCPSNCTLLR